MTWLPNAVKIKSPNFDARPLDQAVDLLIIHNISLPPNKYDSCYVEDFFCNQLDASAHPYFEEISSLKVSSHLYIRRTGKLIQFVPFSKRAWHAGESEWCGRAKCNDYSIGIELEGSDDEVFTDEQYTCLVKVTLEIQHIYPKIMKSNIVGHSDVAPKRKTDPGPFFEWGRYLSGLD